MGNISLDLKTFQTSRTEIIALALNIVLKLLDSVGVQVQAEKLQIIMSLSFSILSCFINLTSMLRHTVCLLSDRDFRLPEQVTK